MSVIHETSNLEPLCHIVTPIGMLGYGLDLEETCSTVESLVATGTPTALILDSGSTDSGPQKLALGGMTVPRSSYVRDLQKLLHCSQRFGIPLIFSSAGGSGTDENTLAIVKIVEEIAAETLSGSHKVKVVALFSDIPKSVVKERLSAGAISPCGSVVPALNEADIDDATVIASQMGPEPFIDALEGTPDLDVLIGGRAYDPVPYVAFAEICYRKAGHDPDVKMSARLGGFTHMGKIMECGGICATPKSSGATATVYIDGTFDITPTKLTTRCTPLSVAAHTLYEKSRPDKLFGPGGHLDLTKATYAQLEDKRTVRVRGGLFENSTRQGRDIYQVKLEGAKATGYRAIYIGAHKDAILTSQLDDLLAMIRDHVAAQVGDIDGFWDIKWHLYGNHANDRVGSDVCIIGEVIAPTQELATNIAATAKVANIHGAYKGQKATSGNLAFGIGGQQVIPTGQCAEFCVYHLMDLQKGEERLDGDNELFRMKKYEFLRGNVLQDSENLIKSGAVASKSKPPTNGRNEDAANSLSTSTSRPPASTDTLGDIAQVIRSKNSGPYEITFDVMFEQQEVYHAVKDADILNAHTACALFGIDDDQIIWSGFFEQAQAYKLTIPRMRDGKRAVSGGFGEDDVHGSQMYLPLMGLKLPVELRERLHTIFESEK